MQAISLKQDALSGVRWTSLSGFVTATVQLVQLVFIARLLSSREFGLMGMVSLVIGFGQAFADMGLSAALIYRQEISREQLASLYWLNVGAGVSISIILAILSPFAALLFSEPEITPYVICAASVFAISAAGTQFQVLFEKELRFRFLAIQEMAGTAAGASLSVILVLLGFGVWALVWGFVLAAAVKSAIVAVPGWRSWRPGWGFQTADLKGFVGFGMYQMGERCINYFNFRIDQFVIGTLLGAQALGYYNFAFGLVMQPQTRINPVVTRVAFPVFARLQGDEDRLRRGYLGVLRVLTSINAPLLLGLVVVAPSLIPLVFGGQWRNAVPLVQILAVFALVRSTGNPVGSLLLARGRADLGFRWNLFLLLLVPPIVYYTARTGGLTSVAIAMVGLQAALLLVAYRYLIVPIIGHCLGDFLRALSIPVGIAGLMGATVWVLSIVTAPLPATLGLLIGIIFGGAIYLSLTWLLNRDSLRDMISLVKTH
jgi:O-antigen/teichoic acid export membrane protein